jgi:Protein of unknown function (DUF4239)
MNIYVAGAIWVLGIAAVAAAVTILVHRVSHGDRNAGDAVSGVFTIVAGVQAVLIAFVLISLFDAVSSVRDGSHTEANALVGVFWASDSLPPAARDQIQGMARAYAGTVIEQEWPRMREGEPVGGNGWELLERMRGAIDTAATENDWQQERRSEAASQLWAVYEARQARLTAAGNVGVTSVVWIALIVGSVLTLALPYLFDVPKLVTHMVVVGILAGTIALLLFSIYQLQNPFSGGAQFEPDAFRSAMDQMHGRAA